MATAVAMADAMAISDGERALGTWSRAASRAPNRSAPTPCACHEAAVAGRQPDLTPPCRCSPSPPRIRGSRARGRRGLRAPRAMLDGAARRPRPRAPPASRARRRRLLLPHGPRRRCRRPLAHPPLACVARSSCRREEREGGREKMSLWVRGAGGRPAVFFRSDAL